MEKFILSAGKGRLELPLCEEASKAGITKDALTAFQGEIDAVLTAAKGTVAKDAHDKIVADLQAAKTAQEKAAGELKTAQDSVATLTKERDALKGEIEKAKGTQTAADAIVKSLQDEVKVLQNRNIIAEVERYAQVRDTVRELGVDSAEISGKDLRTLKTLFLGKIQGKKPEDYQGMTDVAIDAAYDALSSYQAAQRQLPRGSQTVKTIGGGKTGGEIEKLQEARYNLFGQKPDAGAKKN